MAKNISLLGANYPDVPAVVLPQTGGGNAMFVDADDVTTAEESIAIVVDGDTAPKAISAKKYLFIKNHSTLSTGGYHATANIASGGTVSESNVAADPDGIVNGLAAWVDNIGNTVSENLAQVSVPNATMTDCGHTTLAAGTWLIIRGIDFDVNANGYRRISSTGAAGRGDNVTVPAVANFDTYVQHEQIVTLNASTDIHVYAYHTCGNALSAWAYIQAVRIR